MYYTRIDLKMESLDVKLPLLSKLYDSCFLTERFIFVTTVSGCCLLCLGLLKILIKVTSMGMKIVTHMTL